MHDSRGSVAEKPVGPIPRTKAKDAGVLVWMIVGAVVGVALHMLLQACGWF